MQAAINIEEGREVVKNVHDYSHGEALVLINQQLEHVCDSLHVLETRSGSLETIVEKRLGCLERIEKAFDRFANSAVMWRLRAVEAILYSAVGIALMAVIVTILKQISLTIK